MFNILSHQENENQKYNEILSHPSQSNYPQKNKRNLFLT